MSLIAKFDYVVLHCGYGKRFIEAFERGDINSIDNVNMVSIHSHEFSGNDKIRDDRIYKPEEFELVSSIVGKEKFNSSYGTLAFCCMDEENKNIPMFLSDVAFILRILDEDFKLCACFTFDYITWLQYHEKNGIRIVEIEFNTESG